jgi:hypothetical protein
MNGLMGGLVRLWLNIQTPAAFKFKRHYVPFNCFTSFSIQALLRSVQKRSHPLKSAYLGLKIERSEILERCAAAFEHRTK